MNNKKGKQLSNRRIDIPGTIDKAVNELTGIGGLLMAKEWERAAIVYAFTEPGVGGPRTSREVVRLGIKQFSELGIKGLATQDSVRKYRDNWQWAIDNDHVGEVKPGDTTKLPNANWPGIESRDNKTRVTGMDPQKLADDIADRDDASDVIRGLMETAAGRKVLRFAVAENEDMVRMISRRHEVTHPKEITIRLSLDEWEQWDDDQKDTFDADTVKAVRHILNASLLRQRGYEPSGDAAIHLELVRPSDIDADYERLVAEVSNR